MIGPLFSRLGFTRDDATWGRLQALSLATLIASGTIDLQYWAAYLGIHLGVTAQHWIIAIAAVVLWVAGKNDTSDLPGKSGPAAGSVDLRKIAPVILLAVALGGGALMSTSCARTSAPVVSPAQSTAKVLTAVRRIGVVLAAVQKDELALYAAGEVPADVHAKIVKSFSETSASVLVALDTLDKSAGGDPHQVVQAVSDGVRSLAGIFGHLTSKQSAQLAGWLDTAAALIDVALAS